jgi:hypothetical protein
MSYSFATVPEKSVIKTGAMVGSKFQTVPIGKNAVNMYVPRASWLASQYRSTIFNEPGTHTSTIPRIDFIKDLTLRVAITVSGSPVSLVPCEYWFEQIDLFDPTNFAIPVQTAYDDTSVVQLLTKAPYGSQKAIFKTSNIEAEGAAKFGVSKTLPVGTHYFYIPLFNSIMTNYGGLFLGDMRNELTLQLKVPSTIVASGSGSISAAIQFGIEGYLMNDVDRKIHRDRLSLSSSECNFLLPHHISLQQNLTAASSDNFIDLEPVKGACAFHCVLIRNTGANNSSNGKMKWLNIGDANDARIEVVDAQNYSITGSLPSRFLRQHGSASQGFNNDFVSSKCCYLVNYCDSILEAFNGRVKGGRYFINNHGNRLRLTLPAAPVSEVQTITFSVAPSAAGYYRLGWKGEWSAMLLGNATVAQMKAAFEAMSTVAAANLSVTFSAIASAGTSLTATFNDPEGVLTGDLMEVLPLDGSAATVSVARTVAGVPGLATGTYAIDVYSYMYRTAKFNGTELQSVPLQISAPGHAQ